MSLDPFGTVAGVQFDENHQSLLIGLRFQMALPLGVKRKDDG
jgi:hypothetical protein